MAIRTLKTTDFDKIAKQEKIIPDNHLNLSNEQLSYLYEKAIDELKICENSLLQLGDLFTDMFCNYEILSSDEFNDFFLYMNTILNCLLPCILKGEHEETYKYCNEELSEDDLNEARIELFTKLYDKYLK